MEKLSQRFAAWIDAREDVVLGMAPTESEILCDEILAALRAHEADGWRPISDKPDRPMPVVFYCTTFMCVDQNGNELSSRMGPVRDEAYELGFFEDGQFFYLGTGHAIFEFPGDEEDLNRPTHFRPLSPPKE